MKFRVIFRFAKIHTFKSTIIGKYWDDIMVYSHSPELYKLVKTNELEKVQIKKLIEYVLKSKREDGDIWPVLLCKQCCEFYENTGIYYLK